MKSKACLHEFQMLMGLHVVTSLPQVPRVAMGLAGQAAGSLQLEMSFHPMALGLLTTGLVMINLQARILNMWAVVQTGFGTLVMMPIEHICSQLAALYVGTRGRPDLIGTVSYQRVAWTNWVGGARVAVGAISLPAASRRRLT